MGNIPVQSSNVSKLCAELGFSGDLPGREERVLTELTLKFPSDSLSRGTPFPFFRADSTEAKQIAARFCNDGGAAGLGRTLWQDNTHNSWPSWSRDQAKILALVAHIFSLQAFYKYQKLCKDKKKQRTEEPAPNMLSSQSSIRTRELSPESRVYVQPTPPKGTRRRPAKKSNATMAMVMVTPNGGHSNSVTEDLTESASSIPAPPNEASNFLSSAYTLSIYIDHVESLDPKDDDGPLRDFTKRWLAKSASSYQWPLSADQRLFFYMHENKFYNPDIEDHKDLEMVNTMRHGSEIEQTQPREYTILKDRILERVRTLASELEQKKIIAYMKGTLQMVPAFKEIWDEKSDYWGKKALSSATEKRTTDSYGTPDLFDDEEDDCVPAMLRKKASSKGKQPMISTKNISSSIPQRRKSEDVLEVPSTPGKTIANYFNPSPKKRPRTEPPKDFLSGRNLRLSTQLDDDDVLFVDTEPIGHPRTAEQRLRSLSKSEKPVTPQPIISAPSSSRVNHPMTPTSPSRPSETINTAFGRATPPSERSLTRATKAAMSKAVPSIATPNRADTTAAKDTLPAMPPSESTSSKAPSVAVKDTPRSPPSFGSIFSKTSNGATKDPQSSVPSFASTSSTTSAATAKELPPSTPSFGSTSSKRSGTLSEIPVVASSFSSRSQAPSPKTTRRHGSSPAVQDISLKLQRSDGTWDLKGVPAKLYLRTPDLSAFFAFISQRSGVPLADMETLTFKVHFGEHPRQTEIISEKDGNKEWDELKGRIRSFFRFVKDEDPREMRFDLWVGIGDQRTITREHDANDDDDDDEDHNSVGW